MYRNRLIPCLLLRKSGLVITHKFQSASYVGDPINAVKIFNEKGADELAILDIDASRERREPNYELFAKCAVEAFMPLSYGGGLISVQAVRRIFNLGAEKVIIGAAALDNPSLVSELSEEFGKQSIVVSVNINRSWFGGYYVYHPGKRKNTRLNPIHWAQEVQRLGAGEILLNAVFLDGTMKGFDLTLLKTIAANTSVPIIACGSAGKLEDFTNAAHINRIQGLAAGAFFVYQGPHRAVLINYPDEITINSIFPEDINGI